MPLEVAACCRQREEEQRIEMEEVQAPEKLISVFGRPPIKVTRIFLAICNYLCLGYNFLFESTTTRRPGFVALRWLNIFRKGISDPTSRNHSWLSECLLRGMRWDTKNTGEVWHDPETATRPTIAFLLRFLLFAGSIAAATRVNPFSPRNWNYRSSTLLQRFKRLLPVPSDIFVPFRRRLLKPQGPRKSEPGWRYFSCGPFLRL